MNKNIIILFLAVIFLGSSCQDFLTVNEVNPNSASKVPANLLLPAALNSVARNLNQPRRFDFIYLWHGLWSISSGYTQPTNLITYKLINSDYQNSFYNFYIAASNINEVEKAATDPKNVYFLAIAKIMKAYVFQNLVDCWGDVPYTDAFKATSGNLKPKYDKQQAIYEDLVVQLDAAMDLIQNASVDANKVEASSDIMYGGNMGLWLKFANTLKLRILMHQSGMSGRDSYISSNISNTASIGYLGAGEGGLVNPGFVSSDTKMNPFYETFYNAAGSTQSDGVTYYFAGKDAVDFYKANTDPRLGKFFSPYSGTSYDGNIFGTPANLLLPQNVTSKLGYIKGDATAMIGTATKSAPLLTDFESLFIQAEAAQRGFISGSAKAYYEAAIAQSFSYMGLTAAQAAAYLAQDKGQIKFDLAPDKIQLIITQKWASLNGIAPVEIWTDFRRSGFPNFIHFSTDPAVLNPTPPVRLLYPQTELSTNNDNVLAVGNIDSFTSKIFWQNR